MTALSIVFFNATFVRSDSYDRFDLMLGVEATLELTVGERLVLTEPMFPIVELRQALSAWVKNPSADFEFTSMDFEDPGLVWIRRQRSGRWRVGSIIQDDFAIAELDTPEVLAGCHDFAARVDDWVRNELGIEVGDVLGH